MEGTTIPAVGRCLMTVLALAISAACSSSDPQPAANNTQSDAASDSEPCFSDGSNCNPQGTGGSGGGGEPDGASSCSSTADDPCGVKCVTVVVPDVQCVDTTIPGMSKPLADMFPQAWQKTGGTTTSAEGTVSFDVSSCVFTFAHATCGKSWVFDLKGNTCKGDHYGYSSDNPCLFSCDYTCTLVR